MTHTENDKAKALEIAGRFELHEFDVPLAIATALAEQRSEFAETASAPIELLEKDIRKMREELECCAQTFALMGGSGPAHAARVRRLIDEISRRMPSKPNTNGAPSL